MVDGIAEVDDLLVAVRKSRRVAGDGQRQWAFCTPSVRCVRSAPVDGLLEDLRRMKRCYLICMVAIEALQKYPPTRSTGSPGECYAVEPGTEWDKLPPRVRHLGCRVGGAGREGCPYDRKRLIINDANGWTTTFITRSIVTTTAHGPRPLPWVETVTRARYDAE